MLVEREQMATNDNFTTQDYGLANWLVFNRVTLLGAVEYPGDSRKNFIFLPSDRIAELIQAWGEPLSLPTSEPARTCKRFFNAHSVIKRALKESLNVGDD